MAVRIWVIGPCLDQYCPDFSLYFVVVAMYWPKYSVSSRNPPIITKNQAKSYVALRENTTNHLHKLFTVVKYFVHILMLIYTLYIEEN